MEKILTGVSLVLFVSGLLLALPKRPYSKRAFAKELGKRGVKSLVVYTYSSQFPAKLVGDVYVPRFWTQHRGYLVEEALRELNEDCRTQTLLALRGESSEAIVRVERDLLIVLYTSPE